jgi:hypothetical protein
MGKFKKATKGLICGSVVILVFCEVIIQPYSRALSIAKLENSITKWKSSYKILTITQEAKAIIKP